MISSADEFTEASKSNAIRHANPANSVFRFDAISITVFRGKTRISPCFTALSTNICSYLCTHNNQKESDSTLSDGKLTNYLFI